MNTEEIKKMIESLSSKIKDINQEKPNEEIDALMKKISNMSSDKKEIEKNIKLLVDIVRKLNNKK